MRTDYAKGRQGAKKIDGGFVPKCKGERRIKKGSLRGALIVRRRLDKAKKADERNDGLTVREVPRPL